MSTHVELRPEQVDALREIGNIGAGNAATALSQMMGEPVHMGIPTVRLMSVEKIGAQVGAADQIVAAMFLGVQGDAPGHMLFVMSEEAARHVVGVLMGGMSAGDAGDAFTEMELSALQEVGNIMTGSYLGALSQITGLRLEPTPPAVGVDMAGALVGAALAEVAMTCDTALLLESVFSEGDGPSAGDVLYIPTDEALDVVLARLGLSA